MSAILQSFSSLGSSLLQVLIFSCVVLKQSEISIPGISARISQRHGRQRDAVPRMS